MHVPEEIHHQSFPAPLFAPGEQVPSYARVAVDFAFVVAVEEVAEGELAGWGGDLGFEEVEVVVGVAVDDGDADVVVGVVGVGGLVDGGGAGGDYVGGVEAGVHGVGLAGVDHEEHFVVAGGVISGRRERFS